MNENDFPGPLDNQRFGKQPAEQQHADDQQLDAWLEKADPAADIKLDDATSRLCLLWEQSVPVESPSGSALKNAIVRSNDSWVVSLALVAGLMVVCSAGLFWVVSQKAAPPLVDSAGLDDGARQPIDADVLRPEQNDLVASEQATTKPVGKRREREVVEIVTVQHLWKELSERKPKQILPMLELNEVALKGELGQWLEDWSQASPELREKYILQWNGNRIYWLPWAKRWCGSWQDPVLNETALEVIVADEKDACVPYLLTHLDNPQLRKVAWTHMCRLGSVEQLVALTPRAMDCEEVQVLAAALIMDASPQATQVLGQLVADPRCRAAIAKLEIAWPAQHVSNGWAELLGEAEGQQVAAATLLAMIPSPQVDHWLVEQLNSGQHQVAALSVLLLRDTEEARQFLAQSQTQSRSSRRFQKQSLSGRAVVANLPSARQQLVRWSFKVASIPLLSPKVCESCPVSS